MLFAVQSQGFPVEQSPGIAFSMENEGSTEVGQVMPLNLAPVILNCNSHFGHALLALFHGPCKGVDKSISWLAVSDLKLLTGEQYGWLLAHVGVDSDDRPCQGEGVNWLVIGF